MLLFLKLEIAGISGIFDKFYETAVRCLTFSNKSTVCSVI